MAHDFGLLVNFLRHEMAMIALVYQENRGLRLEHGTLRDAAVAAVYLGSVSRYDHPIAIFEIADLIGEGGKRDRIGPDIHRAVAEADRERRTLARADQEVVF